MSKLAEIRKKKLLSQNDLVRLSGVSRSLVTKYETGERDINKASGETLLKLAAALTCNIEDILENMEEIKMERLQKLYNEWRKVTEEGIEEYGGSVDCGEKRVREDFSDYAGLEEEISFEEMLVLEKIIS